MKLEPLDLSEARHAMLKIPRLSARWDAAKRDRLTFDLRSGVLSVNQEVALDQEQLVIRSRDLASNDAIMAKFLASIWKNVFGPDGIKLQSKILLQRGSKPNITANKIIEGAWDEWSKKQNCTVDKRLSWVQLQRVVCRTVAIDGECFIRKVKQASNPFGFALQIISSDRVDRIHVRSVPVKLQNGNWLFMGIEYSIPDGAVVAYHIFDRHPSEFGAGPRQLIRIPAEEIIHVFLPIRDNQFRGIPWAANAMFMMNQLKGYREAEVVAARVASCQMGFITQNVDPDPQYTGAGAPEPSNNGVSEMPLEAGTFKFLLPGESVAQFKPEHPTSAFESFTKGANQVIASGLDQAYMTLSGDVGAANYSSARVSLLDERDTWEGLQGFYIEELCQPIFTEWLKMTFITYLRGSLPGVDYSAFDKVRWHPRSFPWVDPLKDGQATVLKLKAGLTTRHRELAAQGFDYDETMQELEEEMKDQVARGLDLNADVRGNLDVPAPGAANEQPGGAQGDSAAAPKARTLTDLVMSARRRE